MVFIVYLATQEQVFNAASLFYAGLYAVFLPLTLLLFLFIPMYWALKIKQPLLFILTMGGILVAEYALYTFLISDDRINSLVNSMISLLFVPVFFPEPLGIKYKRSDFYQRSYF
ncbi:hypothetical protein C5O19_08770 [Siphonobacter curvatus]|uniref:Uncharacterized protein n=1 Tax=Siphonobacter curvatus TaxID=2094562 RepID=A0A2S7IQ00_9BACT|nr:hypothetical protein C5O19_08770 [Siphonobacter curvatus]